MIKLEKNEIKVCKEENVCETISDVFNRNSYWWFLDFSAIVNAKKTAYGDSPSSFVAIATLDSGGSVFWRIVDNKVVGIRIKEEKPNFAYFNPFEDSILYSVPRFWIDPEFAEESGNIYTSGIRRYDTLSGETATSKTIYNENQNPEFIIIEKETFESILRKAEENSFRYNLAYETNELYSYQSALANGELLSLRNLVYTSGYGVDPALEFDAKVAVLEQLLSIKPDSRELEHVLDSFYYMFI